MTTRPFRGTLCGCSFTSCPGHIPATVLHPAHDLQTSEEQMSVGGESVSLEGKKVCVCVHRRGTYQREQARDEELLVFDCLHD